jgi:excisionase family DNA binding protein
MFLWFKMENLKDYLTIKEASDVLGVSSMTLRRWDNSGKLKSYRHPLNRYRLYKKEELENLLKGISND